MNRGTGSSAGPRPFAHSLWMAGTPASKMRYLDLSTFLRQRFGCRIHKIPVDAGFTCPNRDGTISSDGCIYCDAKGSGTGAWKKGIDVAGQIRRAMGPMRRKYKAAGFLAYFQAFTNTYAPLERLRTLYDEALSIPGVVGLCIGTRPDCLEDPVLDLIQSYTSRGMVWLELGLQSAHDETLRRINRGHDYETFRHAVMEAARRGILVCAHLIVGLPGEGMEEVRLSTARISGLPLHGVKLHCLYVVRGTALERMFRDGLYEPWSRDRYVDAVCDILERIPPQWVVQRLAADPPRDTLVAPLWTLDKQATVAAIRHRLEERDTWQGRLLGHPMERLPV
jgi:radical SAM protein (TIGR01212 family)